MEDLCKLISDRQIKQFWNQLMESSEVGGQHQRNKTEEGKIQLVTTEDEQGRGKQRCRTREGSK